MKKVVIFIITIFVVLIMLILFLPGLNSDYYKNGKLYISNILAANASIKEDNNGEYSDYIEIYNGYNFPVNLLNYHLSDSEYEINKWTFPDITIKPKEYLIVYATGNDTCDIENRICHTNFKLSSKGEIITLSDQTGNIISKVNYPLQYPDTYYSYIKNKYQYVNKDGEIVKFKTVSSKKYKLEITEYMTHNKNSVYDNYGNYYDWIEVHNNSKDNYSLLGLYITDDKTNLKKYALPEKEIKSGEYLILYFSSNKVVDNENIYVNFGLSDKDQNIIISNGNNIIDSVPVVKLEDDISYGKEKDKWYYFTTPTPGRENNTKGFTSFGGDNGNN